jgi:uncharacterized membrane protein
MTDTSGAVDGSKNQTALITYILYLASLLVGVTAIVGVVLAYVSKAEAPDWLKTHYVFLIRTFWVGLLFSVVGVLLMIVVIGWFILIFTLVWWIVRCVQGLMLLQKNQAVPKPQSWLFT